MFTEINGKRVPQRASGSLAKKWLFCKTNVLCNICSIICCKKSWSLLFLVKFLVRLDAWNVTKNDLYRFFPRTILSHVKELPNGYFDYSYKVILFRADIFQNSYFWLLILKPIKSISEIQILTIEMRRLKCFLGNCVFRSIYFAQYIFIICFFYSHQKKVLSKSYLQ